MELISSNFHAVKNIFQFVISLIAFVYSIISSFLLILNQQKFFFLLPFIREWLGFLIQGP